MEVKEKTEIRTTLLNAHFHCPYRYKKIVEEGGLEETEAMAKGTRVHAVLSQINKGQKADVENLSREEKMLVRNATTFQTENPVVEVSMNIPISSEFNLEGTADVIVVQRNLIHDYKTGYVAYPAKASLQLFLYFYLFYHTVQKLPNGVLTFEFVRTGRKETVKLSADKILKVAEKGIEDFLKDTAFEPRLNPFCKYCPYAFECPLIRDLIQHGRGPAKKFAAEVLRYQITRSLSDVDESGVDKLGHAEVYVREREVQKLDVQEAVSIMTPEEVVKAVSALDMKKVPDVVKMLALKRSTKKEVVLDYDVTK